MISLHRFPSLSVIGGSALSLSVLMSTTDPTSAVSSDTRVSFASTDVPDRQGPDPMTTYATLLGGEGYELISRVAVDASGAVYMTGMTSSRNFPAIGPQYRPDVSPITTDDVFVAKLDPISSQLLYSVVIGGSRWEGGIDIAIDDAGAAYVVGVTASSDFPVTIGGAPLHGDQVDGFLLKLSPTGQLDFSTTIGGSSPDYALQVAIACGNHAYVAGSTQSDDFHASNSHSMPFTGNMSYLVRFDPATMMLATPTLIGDGEAEALACDAAGHAYVSGYTYYGIPGVNGSQTQLGGDSDAFVVKTGTTGEGIVFGTDLGGVSHDRGRDLMVGPNGSIHVIGSTYSTDFPVTGSSPNHPRSNDLDGFVVKLTNAGTITYWTVVSTPYNEEAVQLAVDAEDRAWISTRASELSSIVMFTPDGRVAHRFSAPFSDQGLAIVRAPSGELWVGGTTALTTFPVSPNAFQGTFGGYFDGFLVNMIPRVCLAPVISGASVSPSTVWPPNHRMTAATIAYETSGSCDTTACTLTVTNNETTPSNDDVEIVDAHHIRVRAERLGSGSGRKYTITITCRNAEGHSTQEVLNLTVPKRPRYRN